MDKNAEIVAVKPAETLVQNSQIEGGIYLKEGENFYAQHPFDGILGEIAVGEIELPSLRSLISSVVEVSIPHLPKTWGDDIPSASDLAEWAKSHTFGNQANHLMKGIPMEKRKNYPSSLREAISKLSIYDFWNQYVKTQRIDYRPDGSFAPKGKTTPAMPKTYDEWLKSKMRYFNRPSANK